MRSAVNKNNNLVDACFKRDFIDESRFEERPVLDDEQIRSELKFTEIELQGLREELHVQTVELDRYRAEIACLRSDHTKYKSLFESAPIGYLIVDEFLQILEVNPSGAHLLGKRPYQVTRTPFPVYLSPDDRELLKHQVGKATNGAECKMQVRMITPGQTTPVMLYLHPVRNHTQRGFNCLIAMMDITEHHAAEDQLRNARDYLQHIATHDPLTDLPNRRKFSDSLEEAIINARRGATKVAVLMLDLDRFKFINDSLGHDAGDELLCETANRLRAAVRDGDLVARLGGDEFSIILNGIDEISTVEEICESIRLALAAPYKLGRHEVCTAGSIGACLYPTDTTHSKELVKFADAAMYRAKTSGRNCYRFFTQKLSSELSRRFRLESDLRSGIKSEQFDVWFQPICDIHSGEAVGLEALARWHHPQRGLVSPAEFIGVAEECGAIEQLGAWILERACQQVVKLHSDGFENLRLSVNISPKQFAQPGIVSELTETLKKTGLDPHFLELEVTENALFDDDQRSMVIMSELRDLGIQLAIDDFGTGYSSFSRLHRLPISRIKIDQSFVHGLPTDMDDCSIAKAIVSMARDLGIEVVSEGVETKGQLQYLRSIGCGLVQGYLLSEPVGANAILSTLEHCKDKLAMISPSSGLAIHDSNLLKFDQGLRTG